MPRRNLPSPAEVVGAKLAEARRDGLPFDAAWERRAWPAFMRRVTLLSSLSRHEWKAAMTATRGEWRAAYEGTETYFSVALGSRDMLGDGLADYIAEPESVAA